MLTYADIHIASDGDVLVVIDDAGLSSAAVTVRLIGAAFEIVQAGEPRVRVLGVREEVARGLERARSIRIMECRADGAAVVFEKVMIGT